MSSRWRSAFVRSVALLLLASIVAAAPAPAARREERAPCHPLIAWFAISAPDEGGEKPKAAQARRAVQVDGPTLEGARWDVVAVGAGWSGSLATTWINSTDEPLAVVPRVDVSALDAFEAALVRADGTRQPIPVAASEGPGHRSESDVAPLLPGERVSVEVALRGSVHAEAERFDLELPAILGNCPPREGSPLLEARIEVTGGGEPIALEKGPAFAASPSKAALVLELDPPAPIDARPLHVAWKPEGPDETVTLARSRALPAGGHEVTLMVAAPRNPVASSVRAEEVVFVLDTSGSMHGAKLAEAVKAVESCLGALGDGNAFGLVDFDDEVDLFRANAESATKENLAQAREWLGARKAEGGTLLDPGVRAGLGIHGDASAHRLLVVVTDAKIGDGAAATETVRATLGDARLLIVLVGEDGDILEARRLADAGRGEVIASGVETLADRMASLLDAFSSPVAWDLNVDWGSAEPRAVFPARTADIYAGRPLCMRAIIDGTPPAEIHIVGSTADGEGTFDTRVVVDPGGSAAP
jgi:hypothetical protein